MITKIIFPENESKLKLKRISLNLSIWLLFICLFIFSREIFSAATWSVCRSYTIHNVYKWKELDRCTVTSGQWTVGSEQTISNLNKSMAEWKFRWYIDWLTKSNEKNMTKENLSPVLDSRFSIPDANISYPVTKSKWDNHAVKLNCPQLVLFCFVLF